jgi:hypothetical protein
MEDAKTLLRVYDGCYDTVSRTKDSILWLVKTDVKPTIKMAINGQTFPTVKEGETVALKEIAGNET